jgi:hypothetical protein
MNLGSSMFEFNGKKINATDLTSRFLDNATQQVKQEFGERFRSNRHPKSGEFPTVVVYGNSLSDLSLKIEGSEELIEHIKSKLPEEETTHVNFVARRKILTPKVFLSFGWEDHDLAGKIANELMRQGIDTWWADWEIKAGDSIRRRIDEGLGRCTHFLVLLSPNSINKPWVKEEMDAGFTRMLDDSCTFLPLRYNLSHEQLPPLLKGRLSPEVSDDLKLTQVINDIHGISRKPPLGKSPIDQNLPDTGFSVAATTIAKVFCAESEHGSSNDPSFSMEELMEKTGLSKDDAVDALYELRNFIKDDHYSVIPDKELFVEFDKAFMEWDPEKDALRIASSLINDTNFPTSVPQIAEKFGWSSRRMNPALNYLTGREICRDTDICGCYPWEQPYLQESKTGSIRRFVKSRS